MRLFSIFLGVGLLAVSACVSVLPEPQAPDALYRISARGTPISLDQTVLIREPEAPQVMSGRAMVREDQSGAIKLLPNIEWAGRSTRLFQLALADSFSGGSGGAILPESGVGSDFEFSIRFTTLGFVGSEAVCDGAASLIDTKTRKLVAQDRVSIRRPAAQTSPEALKQVSETCVAEFSRVLSDALKTREILDEMP